MSQETRQAFQDREAQRAAAQLERLKQSEEAEVRRLHREVDAERRRRTALESVRARKTHEQWIRDRFVAEDI